MEHPHAGTHSPKSLGEFRAWFRTDADCVDYLDSCGGLAASFARPVVLQEDGDLGREVYVYWMREPLISDSRRHL